MAVLTLQEYMQSDFRGSRSRGKAQSLIEHLLSAANAFEKSEETRAFSAEIRKYAEAMQKASVAPSSVGRDREKQRSVEEGLQTLGGFEEFLTQKDSSGASSYERIMQQMQVFGKAESFREDLRFVCATYGMKDLDLDELDADIQQRNAPKTQEKAPEEKQKAPQPQPQAQPQAPKNPLEENLRIDDLLSKPVEFPNVEEAPPETSVAKYNELDGEDISDAYEGFDAWDTEAPIQMAVDENGRVYQDADEIKSELLKPGRRLFVFREDGSLPHALENRNGRLYASDGEISASNQAEGNRGRPRYQAKRSLAPEDIADIPSFKAVYSVRKYIGDASMAIETLQKQLDQTEYEFRKAKSWMEEDKEDSFHRKPNLSGGQKFWRGIVKTFTLGFGETKAYKKYQKKLSDWTEKAQKYPQQLKDFEKERAPIEKKLKEYREAKKKLSEKKESLEFHYYTGKNQGERELKHYRQQTEVRMEGIADIIKTGRITESNIFANTWMAKCACAGKSPNDPEAKASLQSYLVSRAIEEQLFDETFLDKEYSGSKGAMLGILNNGQALKQLVKSKVYREMMDDWGDKPFDPEAMYNDFTARERERNAELNHPLAKLRAQRKSLIDEFGEKPLTKDCLKDIAQLTMLDKAIQRAEKLPKNPDELTPEQRKDFEISLANLGKKSLLKNYMNPEYERAVQTVIDNQAKTLKNINSAFMDHPQLKAYVSFQSEKGVYKLDKMAELVNGAVEVNRQKQAQQGLSK